jgi:hypothetical protein
MRSQKKMSADFAKYYISADMACPHVCGCKSAVPVLPLLNGGLPPGPDFFLFF